MQLQTNIQMTYPDGPEAPPVCSSADVIAEYDLNELGVQFMQCSSRKRREGLQGSRNEKPGPEPLHLYKYRSLNAKDEESISKARSILVQDRIWAASPESLNDPKDMRFKLSLNQDVDTRKKWVKENAHLLPKSSPAKRLLQQQQLVRSGMTPEMELAFKQDMERNMGVFCVSTDPRSQVLWALYAAEHRGICIQLSPYEDELFLIAKKVIYSKEFPTIVVPTPPGARQEYYLHKSSGWANEKEWRVVLPFNNRSISLRPLAISAVILGARIENETIAAVMGLLQERALSGKPPLRLYQAKLDDESYDINIRRHDGRPVRH